MKQPRTSTTLTTLTLFTTFTLCLAGCSPNQLATSKAPSEELSYSRQPVPPTTTPKTPTTSTPSLSTSADVWQSFPPAPADEPDDITAIRKGWENHENEFDRFIKDSSLKDFSSLVLTTDGQATATVINAIGDQREKGRVRRGNLVFRNVRISPPHMDDKNTRITTLSACKDFTGQQLIMENTGKPADPPKGGWIKTLQIEYTMKQQPNGVWVTIDTRSEEASC